MNTRINDEFKIAEKYKQQSNYRIREMENTILYQKLPDLRKVSNDYENQMTQEILKFENKTTADGYKLQGLVKTEISILHDDLAREEHKRREYDSNLL